jgi:hypothetical protein
MEPEQTTIAIKRPSLRQRKRAERCNAQRLNRERNLKKGKNASLQRDSFAQIVEKMTNWERTQWARAGYPGLHNKDIDALLPHAQAAQRRRDGTFVTRAELASR